MYLFYFDDDLVFNWYKQKNSDSQPQTKLALIIRHMLIQISIKELQTWEAMEAIIFRIKLIKTKNSLRLIPLGISAFLTV